MIMHGFVSRSNEVGAVAAATEERKIWAGRRYSGVTGLS